jgi:pimeloyl-ACP methyl ester carboxylesterase
MTTQHITLPSGVSIHMRIDDFTPPWADPPVALLLHGTAETSEAYRLWTPWLSRHFKVVAPDLRGMGASNGVDADSRIEMADLVGDAHALMQALGVPRYFVVGEKLGALIGLSLASKHPESVRAASLACGMVSPARMLGRWIPEWKALVRVRGPRGWIDATQAGRMGDELDAAALEWWSALMARSASVDVLFAYLDLLSRLEVTPATLQSVRCPTLFLVPSLAAPSNGSFDQRSPRTEADAWRALVSGHRVAEIASASYHLAATRPDDCAIATRDFFLSLPSGDTQTP